MEQGGVSHARRSSDGAYCVKPGSYSKQTAGRIARNLLTFSHNCADQRAYKQNSKDLGLVPHGASYPLSLATFLVEFMTEKGDLVVDPMAGSFTTAKAAENTGRRWIGSELMRNYVQGSATRFKDAQGFKLAL